MSKVKIQFEVTIPDVLLSNDEISEYLEFKYVEGGSCANRIYDMLEGQCEINYRSFQWEWL